MTGLPFERWEMKVRLLSPVHVGSGWELTPDEYVLRQDNQVDVLEVVDRAAILRDLDENARKELDGVLARGDARGIQDWMMRRYQPGKHRRFKVQVQAPVARDLRAHLKGGTSQCIVALAARDPGTGNPYLPGSAIKGAIRTAYLAFVTARDRITVPPGGGSSDRAFQERALGIGKFGTDPFRQIALADIPLEQDAMLIDQVRIVHLKPKAAHGGRESDGILMFRDVTWSLCDGEEIDACGEVRINGSLADRRLVSQPIGIEDIIRSCREHYLPALRSELKAYDGIIDEPAARDISNAAESLGEHETIIRIGRHSHFECMTIPDVRRPPRLGFGKTRSYVGGVIPMGWCRLLFKRIG